MMFGSAKSEHPKLTNREIIFDEFQPVIMIPQRSTQTDREKDDLPYQYRALRSIAW